MPFFFLRVALNNDAKKTKINQSTTFSAIHRDQIVCLKVAPVLKEKEKGKAKTSTSFASHKLKSNFYWVGFQSIAPRWGIVCTWKSFLEMKSMQFTEGAAQTRDGLTHAQESVSSYVNTHLAAASLIA